MKKASMRKTLKQIKESFIFAINSVIVNKLRTFLSLLGITIGIFSIITVFTVIDSLENRIRTSIASLGENVVYIERFPWVSDGEYPWWKYLMRPVTSQEEETLLKKKLSLAEAISFIANTNKTIKYESKTFENTPLWGVSDGYDKIRSFELTKGRFISSTEHHTGKNVGVIGSKIAIDLFGTENPIDKNIKVDGRKIRVIGVFEKEGESTIGNNSLDDMIITPVNFIKTIINVRNTDPFMMIKAKEGVAAEDLIDEIRGSLRSIRRLKPREDDNFALNQISQLSQSLNNMFGVINTAGWIIGGFSLLVGGFGIANIMFVSVRERTNLIGIQKALGAKNYFILLQFLYESVLLSIIGGTIGLLLIFILSTIVNASGAYTVSLSASNIILGLTISSIIGIISGFSPAYKASRLNPVEAISANV